jgi:Protein of unknown function (DUF3237)
METSVALKLEHVFDVRIDFNERRLFGPISGGASQGYTSVKSGVVEGPRLNGRVVDYSGADWATVRTDGVVELNAHYLLEASDGTLIYIRNLGYVYGAQPAQVGAQSAPALSSQSTIAPLPRSAYFRCTPYFRAPQGPHDWLNRTVIVGGGERRTNPDHSVFRYYAVS